jgi:hypothetical protein
MPPEVVSAEYYSFSRKSARATGAFTDLTMKRMGISA